jgi:hypothetical protein
VLFVNWLVKPFSMALLGWLFFKHVFAGFLGPDLADQYLAGTIILAAAPCTAMVFVWSYLTDAPDHRDRDGSSGDGRPGKGPAARRHSSWPPTESAKNEEAAQERGRPERWSALG